MAQKRNQKLRIITYLSPGISIEYFDVIRQYFEVITGLESLLIYESRWSGPPPDHVDMFTTNEVDVAFMCGSSLLRLVKADNEFIELCKAGAVHMHDKAQNRPIYYSDIIIHHDNKAKYKEFHDLKGYKWAYSDSDSISGSLAVLAELKRLGTSGQFFGHGIETGSHVKSIEKVLNKTVDVASIDSTILNTFMRNRPDLAAKLHILQSLGPLPIYAIVLNKRLSGKIKDRLTKGLLEIHKQAEWALRLSQFNVTTFVPIDMKAYNKEEELKELAHNLSPSPTYY